MNERDTVNAWLKGLWSPEAEFTLNEAGACAMSIDDVTACFIEVPEGEGRIRFFSPIAPLPEPDDDDERFRLYTAAMEMNMPGGASAGGAIAIDEALDALTLRLDRSLQDMDGVSFANILGGVVSTVRSLRRELYGSDGTEEVSGNRKHQGNIPGLQPNWIQA
ncbi:MAG: CesT family type III secretion system chaperone [Desulfovibrionales bacterium]|nr:CesT family type III secretion system chaperone [Desulfovibrionales bacterium]